MVRRLIPERFVRIVKGDPVAQPPDALPTVAAAVHLVYPPAVASEVLDSLEHTDRPLADLSELRRLMAPFDRQTFPSPVRINFGQVDVAEHDVDGMHLLLDADDTSVSRTLLLTSVYEPHVTAVFRRFIRPGMTVVDVGANVGYFSALASTLVGPEGRVIALEPNSENCRLILLTMLANQAENIEVLPISAAAERGWQYFSTHVGSNGGFIGSTRDDLLDGRGTVVAAFPLDDIIEGPVHLMKLDVEGAEGLVLAGAHTLLDRYRPIVISELSIEMLDRVSHMTIGDYIDALIGRGYALHVVSPTELTTTEITDVARFVADWTDPFRLEELLFLPTPPA